MGQNCFHAEEQNIIHMEQAGHTPGHTLMAVTKQGVGEPCWHLPHTSSGPTGAQHSTGLSICLGGCTGHQELSTAPWKSAPGSPVCLCTEMAVPGQGTWLMPCHPQLPGALALGHKEGS